MSLFKKTITISRTFPSEFWFLTGATFLNHMGNMALVLLVVFLSTVYDFSIAKASAAFAFYAFSMVFSGFISGMIIDRWGAARIMIGSLFLNGAILLCFLATKEYFVILLISLIWGVTTGFYRAAAQTFVSLLATTGNQKVAFSIYRLAINLGMSIGPAMGGYFATHSFRFIFIGNAFANMLSAFLLLSRLRRTAWLDYCPLPTANSISLGKIWFWQDRRLRIFLLGMVPVSMVFYQHATTFSVFLYENLHYSLAFYGLLFTFNTLLIVCFELPLNVATLSWPPHFSLVLGSFFMTIGFAGLFFASSVQEVVLLTAVWTLGEMILYPAASAFIAELATEAHRGRYMSIYAVFSNMGLFLGPWLGALVMEEFTAKGLWLICGVWGFISMLLFAFVTTPNQVTAQKNP